MNPPYRTFGKEGDFMQNKLETDLFILFGLVVKR